MVAWKYITLVAKLLLLDAAVSGLIYIMLYVVVWDGKQMVWSKKPFFVVFWALWWVGAQVVFVLLLNAGHHLIRAETLIEKALRGSAEDEDEGISQAQD